MAAMHSGSLARVTQQYMRELDFMIAGKSSWAIWGIVIVG